MDWATWLVWFVFGVFVGGSVGILLMAMMFVAKDADQQLEEPFSS